jgi:hypothetical protein
LLAQTASPGDGEVEEGINAARILLPKCWFDAERCKPGLEALATTAGTSTSG